MYAQDWSLEEEHSPWLVPVVNKNKNKFRRIEEQQDTRQKAEQAWTYYKQGKARQGKARQGKARQGKARQG